MAVLRLIESGSLEYYDLTFAAEIAGQLQDSEAVRSALLPLLLHEEAVVREGAAYGLASHLTDEVAKQLAELAISDPSPGVRRALKNIMEGHERAFAKS